MTKATVRTIRAALKKASGVSGSFEVGYRHTKRQDQEGYDQREWAEENDLLDLRPFEEIMDTLLKGGVFDVYCYGNNTDLEDYGDLRTNCDLVIDSKGMLVDCYDSVSNTGEARGKHWISELR
jgi:hypothetical protein